MKPFPLWAVSLLLVASAAIPLTLLWDFSWESTVGVDNVWAPPHVANYLAVTLTAVAAMGLICTARSGGSVGVQLGPWQGPLGSWIVIWGSLAFLTAVVFDRWWASSYGLAAGIWHPPQLLKALAFFAVTIGTLLVVWIGRPTGAVGKNGIGLTLAGALVMALITVVSLPLIYANRQHSPSFYLVGCATYPIVLASLVTTNLRWAATGSALLYLLLMVSAVWVLPLVPAQPEVAPVYNPRSSLLPPPFPLLLIIPAFGFDLCRLLAGPIHEARPWLGATILGILFFTLFTLTQWTFAEFLLTDLADNWFFAGGGKHWPFFLKIDAAARTMFCEKGHSFSLQHGVMALGLAVGATFLGLRAGKVITRLSI